MSDSTAEDLLRSLLSDFDPFDEQVTVFFDPFVVPVADWKKTEELLNELRATIEREEPLYPKYVPYKSTNDNLNLSDARVKKMFLANIDSIDRIELSEGYLMFSPRSVKVTPRGDNVQSPAFIFQALILLEPGDPVWKIKINEEVGGEVTRYIEEITTKKSFKRISSLIITDLTVGED